MGYYCQQSDIEAIFGKGNVAAWSNIDNALPTAPDGSIEPDDAQIDAAIARTDAFINAMGIWYHIPVPVPTTVAGFAYLNILAAEHAGISLYLARGLNDNSQQGLWGRFQTRWNQIHGYRTAGGVEVEGEIEDFFVGLEYAVIQVPVAVAATVTPTGAPVTDTPPYPRLSFDGFRWVWG